MVVTVLAILAVISSTLTSSLLFLRFTLLAIEIISSLTINSTNWLLQSVIKKLESNLWGWQKQQQPEKVHTPHQQTKTHVQFSLHSATPIPTMKRRHQLTPLLFNQLSCRKPVNSKYPFSLPGSPDTYYSHHELGI
ncbi:hypothetical protein BDF14DRAFT_1885982 [Spinellus fusiger]|nr:hypothetical protein BDF14DRAFT_1885982 [Spinellus fusiger]